MAGKSRNSLVGSIIKIRKGVAIYRIHASPYYQARILDPRTGGYKVKSTKEKVRTEARKVAEELADEIRSKDRPAEREFSFKYYSQRFFQKSRGQAERRELNANYVRTLTVMLDNDDWGLVRHFGQRDVRELKTRDWQIFIERLSSRRSDLSSSTKNSLMAAFRNVLKVARDDGVIDAVPDTPRVKQKDNPRPFFRFHPLVSKEDDEYKKLLDGARTLAENRTVVRGTEVTEELRDLIMFCVHSFVRPTTTELYALKVSDITVAENPRRLLVTVRNGKTGFRVANTMPGAVGPFERLRERYPQARGDDYLFMPDYENRATAARIFSRWFNQLLEETGLKTDTILGTSRTVYSLRHTALCMRMINSNGKTNILTLARNAGTSVNQIERFYVKNLPMSAELVKNLQSMGEN